MSLWLGALSAVACDVETVEDRSFGGAGGSGGVHDVQSLEHPANGSDAMAAANAPTQGDQFEVGNGVKLGHPDALADVELWFKFLDQLWARQAQYEPPESFALPETSTYAGEFIAANGDLVAAVQELPATDWLADPPDPSAVYCDPLEDPTCGCVEVPGSTYQCPDLPPPNPQTPWEECDRPPVPDITIQGCSAGRKIQLLEAYEHAHYQTWRLNQLLTHIRGVHDAVGPDAAAELWGKSDPNKFRPQYYWGKFDQGRMEAIQETVAFVWDTYFVDDEPLNIACFDDPDFKDIFKPKLLAAKLASPCLYNFLPGVGTVANALYIGVPDLHPNYPNPTVEVCGDLFTFWDDDEDRHRGNAIFHELLHWLVNDIGLLRDKHKPCKNVGDGDRHCQTLGEINSLAGASPNHAARNIYAYNEYALMYASLYLDGSCHGNKVTCFENWGLCNDDNDAQPSSGPPPVPDNCNSEQPGTCEGGECAQIIHNPTTAQQFDIFSPAHPDGDFSQYTYCEGSDMVCVNENGGGRCRTCGPGQRLGCPCEVDAQCADAGLSCWGSDAQGWAGGEGRCWDGADGPPAFQCDEPCEGRSDHTGNDSYYCFHDLTIVDRATCLHTDCGQPDAFCAIDDVEMLCSSSTCINECDDDSHCDQQYGWPAGTVCGGNACIPPN